MLQEKNMNKQTANVYQYDYINMINGKQKSQTKGHY